MGLIEWMWWTHSSRGHWDGGSRVSPRCPRLQGPAVLFVFMISSAAAAAAGWGDAGTRNCAAQHRGKMVKIAAEVWLLGASTRLYILGVPHLEHCINGGHWMTMFIQSAVLHKRRKMSLQRSRNVTLVFKILIDLKCRQISTLSVWRATERRDFTTR